MALQTDTIQLPVATFPPGSVAIDSGGTMAKVAYVPNKGGDAGRDRVHFASLPLRESKAIIELIQANCDPPANAQGEKLIGVTGVGTYGIWTALEKSLGVKLVMRDELNMSVRGFKHMLDQLGPADALHPYTDDDIEEALKIQVPLSKVLLSMAGQTLPEVDPQASPRERMEALFQVNVDVPQSLSKYILLSLGSGAVVINVDGERITPFADVMYSVGKTFHALGKLITGKRTHEELLELAARGNSENVNTVIRDARSLDADAPQGFYGLFPEDALCYFLGKVAEDGKSKEDFAAEDLMAGLLELTCRNIIQRVMNVARAHDADTVFFMGGFVDSPVVRRMLYRYALLATMGELERKVHFHIVKQTSYVEALGCLLSSAEANDTEQNGTQQNGTQQDGTQHNGTQQNGTQQNGTEQNGTQQNGTQQNGTQQNGTQQNGTQQNGTEQKDTEQATKDSES